MLGYQPTFVENVILGKGGFFLYDFSVDDVMGRKVWYIFAVSKSHHNDFISGISANGKELNLNDYGKVLASGFGNAPGIEAWQYIKDKYNIDRLASNS